MKITGWLMSFFTARGKALTMYRRGMFKAKSQDKTGAIDDYTLTINMLDAPLDVKSMALFNRALVYVAVGETSKGTFDLDAVLAMHGAPAKVKDMARQKLIRMNFRTDEDSRKEISQGGID